MTPTESLRAAASRLARAVANRDKIAALIESTAVPLEANSQSDIAGLRMAYETAAAEVALGSATQTQADEARQKLQDANLRRETAEKAVVESAAVRAGLERKLAEADAEVVNANEQVQAAEVAYLEFEIEVADQKYVAAAVEVGYLLLRIHSFRNGLRARGFTAPLRIDHPNLPICGRASAAHVRARLTPECNLAGRPLIAHWDMEAQAAALRSELAEAAQDRGLVARVRRAISATAD